MGMVLPIDSEVAWVDGFKQFFLLLQSLLEVHAAEEGVQQVNGVGLVSQGKESVFLSESFCGATRRIFFFSVVF